MSEVSNKKRQYAQTSTAILGYAQQDCPIDWRLRIGQDVYRSIEIPVHELFKQSNTGNVRVTFTSVSDQDDNYNAERTM